MGTDVRLSQAGLKVLKVFVERPTDELSGADIAKCTGTASGTLYPMLARWEGVGWLSSRWEEIDPSEAARPKRRLYRLTGYGQRQAQEALLGLQLETGAPAWAT
jgi:PadR family transcriptional regulator, regulatory protein PadR